MRKSDFLLVDNSTASSAELWSGGTGTLLAYSSNWNTATATFQISPDGTNFVGTGADGILSEDGSVNFSVPAGFSIKMVVSGTPTALYVRAVNNNKV